MNVTPNVVFPFTHLESVRFNHELLSKNDKKKKYILPDYWFSSEEKMVEFSKTLKDSPKFIDHFQDMILSAINDKIESFIVMTLRTNDAIIFVKIECDGYMETVDKLIQLNVDLERYEQCQQLLEIKTILLESFSPIPKKSPLYEIYEFWKSVYPKYLE